jgi:hypothetical protein
VLVAQEDQQQSQLLELVTKETMLTPTAFGFMLYCHQLKIPNTF